MPAGRRGYVGERPAIRSPTPPSLAFSVPDGGPGVGASGGGWRRDCHPGGSHAGGSAPRNPPGNGNGRSRRLVRLWRITPITRIGRPGWRPWGPSHFEMGGTPSHLDSLPSPRPKTAGIGVRGGNSTRHCRAGQEGSWGMPSPNPPGKGGDRAAGVGTPALQLTAAAGGGARILRCAQDDGGGATAGGGRVAGRRGGSRARVVCARQGEAAAPPTQVTNLRHQERRRRAGARGASSSPGGGERSERGCHGQEHAPALRRDERPAGVGTPALQQRIAFASEGIFFVNGFLRFGRNDRGGQRYEVRPAARWWAGWGAMGRRRAPALRGTANGRLARQTEGGSRWVLRSLSRCAPAG